MQPASMPRFLSVLALLVAALLPPLTSRAGGEIPVNSYTVVALGPLAAAYGINDGGSSGLQVAGRAYGTNGTGGWARAHLWQDGVLTDLSTLGGDLSDAYAVNNYGQAAGFSWTAPWVGHAFLWDPATGMRDLGTLGGDSSWAAAINDAGQVVGGAANAAGAKRAFLWHNGQMVDLGVPVGYVAGEARGINGAGQVVGYLTDAGGVNRAFRWTPAVPNGTSGTMVALHATGGNAAYGINGAGEAVGAAEGGLPTLWDRAGAQALPLLPGSTGGSAWAINDSRYVVGFNYVAAGSRAFVWDAIKGTHDLTVLAGAPAPYPLEVAYAINASGQIVANIEDYSAYLLTPSPLPSRPLNLRAQSTSTGVSLSWNASYGAASYTVKRASASGGPYTAIASVSTTTYTDTGVAGGNTAHYVVCAVNGYGESADSDEVRPRSPPASPTELTATAGDRQVALSWDASDGAGYYTVHRATASGGAYQVAGQVIGTGFADTGLTNGVTYYYVVVAVNSAGASLPSNEASATPTGPPPPAAPTNLTAASGKGKKRIDLKWTQSVSAGVTENRIYRSTGSGGGYSLRATVSATTAFSDTSVTSGVTYYYVVTAVNGPTGKESGASNEASARPR